MNTGGGWGLPPAGGNPDPLGVPQFRPPGPGNQPPVPDPRSPYPGMAAPQRQGDTQQGGELGESSPLVRPYAITGGRTQPRYQLPIEALVSTTAYAHGDLTRLTPECMAIVDLCGDWRSVAEISALLRIPLGVARIIIADMAEQGLVRIHQPVADEGADLNLLERVLSGLRKL